MDVSKTSAVGDLIFYWNDYEPEIATVINVHLYTLTVVHEDGRVARIPKKSTIRVEWAIWKSHLHKNSDNNPVTKSNGHPYVDEYGHQVLFGEPIFVRYTNSIPRAIKVYGKGPRGGMLATIDTRFPSKVTDNGFALNPRVRAVAFANFETPDDIRNAHLLMKIKKL